MDPKLIKRGVSKETRVKIKGMTGREAKAKVGIREFQDKIWPRK